MEDIRNAGLAYFANLSRDEKKLAEKFFQKMFRNCREIGFNEYVEFVRNEGLSMEIAYRSCFNVIDADQNGSLSREDAKPLYYISKTKIITCDVCKVLLTRLFFSCFQCFSRSSGDTFNLCCDCYERKKYRHHEDAIFYDSQNLLFNHKDRRQQREKSELQLTAEAYYKNVTKKIKAEADKFFREMDKNGDNQITYKQYLSSMKLLGYDEMANFEFFGEMNGSGSGQLDFMEVMTVYYVIHSRRPFCGGCDKFMKGVFFTCYDCFDGVENKTFDVCPSCFQSKNYDHKHKHFVDNYALLEGKRIEALREKTSPGRKKRPRLSWPSSQGQSTSLDIVPYQPKDKDKFRWLSAASSLTGITAGLVGIFTSCSIM